MSEQISHPENYGGYSKTLNKAGNDNDIIPDVINTSKLEKPTEEKYGWYSSTSFEEESGWLYQGGEDAYYEALKKWEAVQ